MDNSLITNPSPLPTHTPVGKTFFRALGFGCLLALPLTIIFMFGAGSIINYFRLSYHWGLAGFLVPFAILFYGFCGNAIIMVLATFITLTRSHRPYLHAALIGLIINLIAILGGWGYNLYTYRDQLTELRVQRNNDSFADAKAIDDCAKLTDVNYWRACMRDLVVSAADLSTCKQQAQKYVSQQANIATECDTRYTITSGSVAQCEQLTSGSDDQRFCIYDTIQKSWETNNRTTPLSIVEGCAALSNATEKQACYTISLRQLPAGDATTTLACQSIDTSFWNDTGIGAQDRVMVETKCGVTITAS